MICIVLKSEKRIMIFTSILFEEYFPFSLKYKIKIYEEFLNQDSNLEKRQDKDFVDLSLLLHDELHISVVDDFKRSVPIVKSKQDINQEKLKKYEKYFYFLLKILLKKEIKNTSCYKLDERICAEVKKVLKTIYKDGTEINYKSIAAIIRKNFEFAVLDYYYEKQNILQ